VHHIFPLVLAYFVIGVVSLVLVFTASKDPQIAEGNS